MTNSDSAKTEDIADDLEVTNTSGHLRVALEITIAALILVGIYYLFEPEESLELAPPINENEIDPVIRNRIEAAKADQMVAEPPPEQASIDRESPPTLSDQPLTNGASTPAPVIEKAEPAAKSDQPIDSARELIAKMRRGELTLNSTEIIERSEQFNQQGRYTDTYLLLFHAAREGDGQAAFALASLYDPKHFQTGNALLEKPDIFQAHKWYSKAAKQQIPDAQLRLKALRSEIERQAEAGDSTAQRLLLNWQ